MKLSYAFKKQYDIVVGGAGVAGIAAAVESARAGAKVALIEKTILPGGLATSGLINIFLPLCDGNGNQIIFGIAEELLKLSVKYGPGAIPPGWNGHGRKKVNRYMVKFSPAAFVLALDEFLEENKIDIWYDTSITGVEINVRKITGVEVFNKSGKGLVEANCFIDTTGDADIANFADCKIVEGENNMSIWAVQASIQKAQSAIKFNDSDLLNDIVRIGADDLGKGHPDGEKTWKGINGKNVTEYSIKTRQYLLEHFKKQISEKTGQAPFPLTLPSIPQFRKTRRIAGCETIKPSDANNRIKNTIGAIPDWREAGKKWTIPEGALVPKNIDNLFAAGRIISTEGDAWEAFRVIPAAALTGELAGRLAFEKLS